MQSPNFFNDNYNDFYIVMESTSPEDAKMKIISEKADNESHYLRFSTCLQSFYGRNRNRRLWNPLHVKEMLNASTILELMAKGSWTGEAGHPVPATGKVSIDRILTIDPLRCSHRIVSISWPNDNEVHGIIETLDEGVGSPGYRFYKNIQQGIQPAFSFRSLVPQRKNPDGSTDTIGAGRAVTYDRVYLPSHKESYMDIEVPVKEVIKKNDFEVVMESYCDFITSHSDKIRKIADDFDPVMESASYIPENDMLSIKTGAGTIFVAPELKYRRELKNLYNEFNL